MSAMQQPTKDLLRDTLVAATDALIAEKRKALGWEHYAGDLIQVHTANLKREFRIGVTVGAMVGIVATTLLWVLP